MKGQSQKRSNCQGPVAGSQSHVFMFIVCLCRCICVSVCYVYAGAQGGQKMMSDPLEPELQTVAGKQTQVFQKGSKQSQLLSHLSSRNRREFLQ